MRPGLRRGSPLSVLWLTLVWVLLWGTFDALERYARREDVPVHAGADRPLTRAPIAASHLAPCLMRLASARSRRGSG